MQKIVASGENYFIFGLIERNEFMSKRYLVSVILLCFGAATIVASISCGSDKEKSAKLSGDVTELVRQYQEMKQIGLSGQVEPFLAMRDSLTNAEVNAYFERKGWEIDSVKVSSWSYNWPDVAGVPLIQDTTHGLWRRLIFKQCGMFDEQGREQCVYSIIMFRKNGDEWKVGNASRVASYRFNDDGSPIVLEEHRYHKMFRLPPSFIDLHERVGPSNIEPRPINPDDTLPFKPGRK